MDDLKKRIIERLVKEKGGTPEMYQQVMDEIAWHESRGDYTARQSPKGPGRGGFQFEKGWAYKKNGKQYIRDKDGNKVIDSEGPAGIAYKRTRKYLEDNDMEVPNWLKDFGDVIPGDPDAFNTRRLSREQQEILFLGDVRMKKGADLAKLWTGEEDLGEFWSKYWKTESPKEGRTREANLEQWNTSRAELSELGDNIPEFMSSGRFVLPESTADSSSISDIMGEQSTSVDNSPIDIEYVDPTNALGLDQGNMFALGGLVNNISGGEVNRFNEGGSHATSPIGGIPQGIGSNGKPNLVEEGEVSVKLDRGKFIFSNNVYTDGRMKGGNDMSNIFQLGGLIDKLHIEEDMSINPNESEKRHDVKGSRDLKLNRASSLIMSYPKDGNYRSRIHTPKHLLEIQDRFQDIHKKSGGNCLAGALNCGTSSDDHKSFGYIQEAISNAPSIRGYTTEETLRKYNTYDEKSGGVWYKNNSIDSWEQHDLLRNEGLGYAPFEEDKFTYKKDGIVPDQVLDNASSLPINTLITLGDYNTRAGSVGYNERNAIEGVKGRHTVNVVGYAEEDGMPLVYDDGNFRRLDDLRYKRLGRIHTITVPNAYKKATYDNIINYPKNVLGFGSDNDSEISYSNKHNLDSINKIEEGVNESRSSIGTYYDVDSKTINNVLKYLPNLSYTETKLGGEGGPTAHTVEDLRISNSLLKPAYKTAKNIYSSVRGGESNKQDWELELEALNESEGDFDKFQELARSKIRSKGRSKSKDDLKSSRGILKVKYMSDYAKSKGYTVNDLYDEKVSAEVASSILVSNFLEAKERFKNLGITDEEAIDLAYIGYSNNSKFISEDFYKNYIKDGGHEFLKDDKLETIKSAMDYVDREVTRRDRKKKELNETRSMTRLNPPAWSKI